MIIKASKVSNRNINKSLSSIKKFIKIFKIVFLKILTDREKNIQEMIPLSNIFLLFEAKLKCGRVIY